MKKLFLILCLLQISWCKVDKSWWKYTTVYGIFLPSFKDGDGDGMGDLKGLLSKLDHFVDMGVESIYITSHYESPMADSGFDVTNFTAVNPLMGTMEDFDMLIKEMNTRGLKLIVDLVFNHCSDEHVWFSKSINREEPYTDYFIWKDPKGYDTNGRPIPPNNWVSVFSGSAWTWNDQRKQFYFHQFTPKQPDFNLRNTAMKNELKKIIKFWMDKGVAGFRFDASKHYLEDEQFRDEPVSSSNIKVPFQYNDLDHIYTTHVRDTYRLGHEFRKFLEKISKKFTDYERIFISEDYAEGKLLYDWYGTEKYKIMHHPLNFILNYVINYENASYYHHTINKYLSNLPEGATPNWNVENHDKFRKGYLFNEEYGFIFTSMVMMLPGMVFLYYGQEINVSGSKIRQDQLKNLFLDDFTLTYRDYFRHPMPWDDSLNAGFSTSDEIYLPLSPNYWRVNVRRQREDPYSYYNMFKKLINLRRTDTLKQGDFKSYVISTWVFAFTRTLKGREIYITIFNMGSETKFIDLFNNVDDLPESMTVEVASPNSGYKIGDQVPTIQTIPKILMLRPLTVLVLSSRLFSV